MDLENWPGQASNSFMGGEHTYSLHLDVQAATLNESFGHQDGWIREGEIPKHHVVRTIGSKVKYGSYSHPIGGVSLSDGSKLRDLEGNCRILPRPANHGSLVSVGLLQHEPAHIDSDPVDNFSYNSHFNIHLFIPPNQFDVLVNHLRSGRLPSSFEVHVRGMSQSTEFQYQWDVKASPALPVVYFEASFVAAVDGSFAIEGKAFNKIKEPSYYPVSKADFEALLQLLKNSAERVDSLVKIVSWSGAGILLLAALILWRLKS